MVVLVDGRQEMRLWPKWHRRSESGVNAAASWTLNLSVYKRAPNLYTLPLRNVETPYDSRRREDAGEWANRKASRTACGFGMSEEANAVL